jgi:hypothetical protein
VGFGLGLAKSFGSSVCDTWLPQHFWALNNVIKYTIKELLAIAAQHASSEETVGAVLSLGDRKAQAQGMHHDEKLHALRGSHQGQGDLGGKGMTHFPREEAVMVVYDGAPPCPQGVPCVYPKSQDPNLIQLGTQTRARQDSQDPLPSQMLALLRIRTMAQEHRDFKDIGF